MKSKLMRLLPEIDWIRDSKLKEKVITCHIDALAEGGWKPEDMDRMPFAQAYPGCVTSYIAHTRAVTRMCRNAAEEFNAMYKGQGDYTVDFDTVVAGAILHDIGKLLEWAERPDGTFGKSAAAKYLRHPTSGAILAKKNGIPDSICHIIAYHAHEGDCVKRTPEGMMIHMMDFLNFNCIRAAMGIA